MHAKPYNYLQEEDSPVEDVMILHAPQLPIVHESQVCICSVFIYIMYTYFDPKIKFIIIVLGNRPESSNKTIILQLYSYPHQK